VKNYNGTWTIRGTFTVTNNGTVAAQASWWDLMYLDNNSNGPRTQHTTALAAGASYPMQFNYLAATSKGYHTLSVKTDFYDQLVEASETNNVASALVNLP
jgi:subtilase family serine protease